MTTLIQLTPNDFVAIGFTPTANLAARWTQAYRWSRFPASMPAAWFQVEIGPQPAPCRWCVDGRKPDRTGFCPHCKGTRNETRLDAATVSFGKTRMSGHVVSRRLAAEFFAAKGHPFTSSDVERMTKAQEDAEIEVSTRAHEERERLTDEHQKGEGDGYKRRE